MFEYAIVRSLHVLSLESVLTFKLVAQMFPRVLSSGTLLVLGPEMGAVWAQKKRVVSVPVILHLMLDVV